MQKHIYIPFTKAQRKICLDNGKKVNGISARWKISIDGNTFLYCINETNKPTKNVFGCGIPQRVIFDFAVRKKSIISHIWFYVDKMFWPR